MEDKCVSWQHLNWKSVHCSYLFFYFFFFFSFLFLFFFSTFPNKLHIVYFTYLSRKMHLPRRTQWHAQHCAWHEWRHTQHPNTEIAPMPWLGHARFVALPCVMCARSSPPEKICCPVGSRLYTLSRSSVGCFVESTHSTYLRGTLYTVFQTQVLFLCLNQHNSASHHHFFTLWGTLVNKGWTTSHGTSLLQL